MAESFADYVIDIQNRLKDQRVLDVGCLATTEHNILKRHNQYGKYTKEIIGVDYNKEFLEAAKSNGAKNLYYLDITDNDGVEKFIEQFGTFDYVISTDVIEHISNLGLFLDNIYKLMNVGGSFYVTTPNALCPNWIYWAIESGGKTKVNPDHICYFDIQTLTSLLGRSKLIVDEVMFQSAPEESIKKLELKSEIWMGKRIYIIAKKERIC